MCKCISYLRPVPKYMGPPARERVPPARKLLADIQPLSRLTWMSDPWRDGTPRGPRRIESRQYAMCGHLRRW